MLVTCFLFFVFFVDDDSLFFRASENECEVMKNILSTYEAPSGQSINFNKSEIFFNRNVNEDKRRFLSNLLGVRACLGTGNYLGLPL